MEPKPFPGRKEGEDSLQWRHCVFEVGRSEELVNTESATADFPHGQEGKKKCINQTTEALSILKPLNLIREEKTEHKTFF